MELSFDLHTPLHVLLDMPASQLALYRAWYRIKAKPDKPKKEKIPIKNPESLEAEKAQMRLVLG